MGNDQADATGLKVGWVGTGRMGFAMASRLAKAFADT
jgi:3-hydroxyisobutyrate dehydrogenase-like beta-hydroxyacid dehydrogenase